MNVDTIVCADALDFLRGLADGCTNCVVTSPPYFGLRTYLPDGHPNKRHELGSEPTPAAYVAALVAVFREARRVLRDDGVCWINLGDSYASQGGPVKNEFKKLMGTSQAMLDASQYNVSRNSQRFPGVKPKDLLGIPWRVAFALQDDGWYLRSDIIWHKPNPMPESVTDRPTRAHEYVFLLTKSGRYWYDNEAIRELATDYLHKGAPILNDTGWTNGAGRNEHRTDKQSQVGNRRYAGFNERWDARPHPLATRNRRSVWTVATEPTPFAHFATFPQKLIEPMVLAGCPAGGLVLDPFMGAGTTALVARNLGRHYIGCDLSAEYVALALDRLRNSDPLQDRTVAPGVVQRSLFADAGDDGAVTP